MRACKAVENKWAVNEGGESTLLFRFSVRSEDQRAWKDFCEMKCRVVRAKQVALCCAVLCVLQIGMGVGSLWSHEVSLDPLVCSVCFLILACGLALAQSSPTAVAEKKSLDQKIDDLFGQLAGPFVNAIFTLFLPILT